MVDKDFCLSSYMAYRYTYKDGVEYAEGMHHQNFIPIPSDEKVKIKTAEDIDAKLKKDFEKIFTKYKKVGVLLSGGMDSAILASYLKPGSHAYTFSSDITEAFDSDLNRAKAYAEKYKLIHTIVNISFADFKMLTPIVMKSKCGPVHSIEPQIYKAARQALSDGVELMVIGDGADYVFGGMDQLLGKDWKYEDFINRYISLDPYKVLTNPVYVYEPFEKYKRGDDIDFEGFLDDLCTNESYSSYMNAFQAARMRYKDPYEDMMMADPKDLKRIRSGASKYLIRELYKIKYPEREIPTKIPMPRPVDEIFKNWEGPNRPEFRKDIPMDKLTGNQKWQLWCAEQFLNSLD